MNVCLIDVCLFVCVNHTDSVCSWHWVSQVDQRPYKYRETVPVQRGRTSTERPYQYRETIPVQRPVPLALHHEVGGQDPGVPVPGVIG